MFRLKGEKQNYWQLYIQQEPEQDSFQFCYLCLVISLTNHGNRELHATFWVQDFSSHYYAENRLNWIMRRENGKECSNTQFTHSKGLVLHAPKNQSM